jgi:hypothetical protein
MGSPPVLPAIEMSGGENTAPSLISWSVMGRLISSDAGFVGLSR